MFMGDNSAKAMALQSGQVDLVENITNVADIQSFEESDDLYRRYCIWCTLRIFMDEL